MAEVLWTEEKGSDVNLASYLLLDGFVGDYEKALVVSNDSDLIEPISIVRDVLKLPVGVAIPDPKTRQSALSSATFYKRIRKRHLEEAQFPETVTDGNGRSVHRPPAWTEGGARPQK